MRVVIVGANGQLGAQLGVGRTGMTVVPFSHSVLDITYMARVRHAFSEASPDIVINSAAFTKVDESESNPDMAYSVNAIGARNVAVAAEECDAKLVYISTDYVFGNERASTKIPYTEFDTPSPINVYGKSKLAGEEFVKHLSSRYFIVRTSGLFGRAHGGGQANNFVETIVKLSKEKEEIRVVNDQMCSPTYTVDLANAVFNLISTDFYGTFHVTNSFSCTWYDFASEILNLVGSRTLILPVTSKQYPQAAMRPSFSVLDNYHSRLLEMDGLRSWRDALRAYMREMGHIQ